MLFLDPIEHEVLGAGGEHLARALDDVDDVRAELAEFVSEGLTLVLRATKQPRRHAGGGHDEWQDDDRQHRLDDPQPDHREHRHDERDDQRRGQVRGEQLEELGVGHGRAGDVPGPTRQEVGGRQDPEPLVELRSEAIEQAERHDVDDDGLEPSEHRDRQRERDHEPDEGPQIRRRRAVQRPADEHPAGDGRREREHVHEQVGQHPADEQRAVRAEQARDGPKASREAPQGSDRGGGGRGGNGGAHPASSCAATSRA